MTVRADTDRGSVSIEFAILMGALIVGYFTLMIVAGRILQQENDVRSAAQAAARVASLYDTEDEALANATAVALENLSDSGVSCLDQQVSIVAANTDFVPGGRVTIRVECVAGTIGDYGLLADPFVYEATEPIDVFRGDP